MICRVCRWRPARPSRPRCPSCDWYFYTYKKDRSPELVARHGRRIFERMLTERAESP